MERDYKTLLLHFKYCTFIAVMVVVGIATEKWSESKEFTTYLSNAATMTSLLLGVVAIFYSFISNDGMSKSLGSITTVSTEVRGAREEIEHFSKLTQDATRESSNNTEAVREASSNLSDSLGSLSTTLQQLTEQNDALKAFVTILPTRMDQLETKFSDVAKAIGEKPQTAQRQKAAREIAPEMVEDFLARASLTQNLLSYACVLAHKKKKPLSITQFCEAVEYKTPSSYNGFLTCMYATQLCYRRAVEGQEKTYTISSIDPTLEARSRPYFIDYVTQNYADKPDEKDLWLKRLEAVEALYN